MKINNNNIITLEYVKELDKTTKFVSLTMDAMFKSIMKRNKKVLKDFIVEAFGFDDVKDTDEIEFLANDLEKSNINEKGKLIDLNLRLGEKYIIDIEMNKTLYTYTRERNDMYYHKFVTLQVKVGDNYKNVEQLVIFQLNLNASEKEKLDEPDHKFVTCDEYDDKKLYDENKRAIFTKTLVKYRNEYYNKTRDLKKDDLFIVMLTSKNYTELYNILSKFVSDEERDKLIRDVIVMSEKYTPLHEWEKEAMDAMVERAIEREALKQGLEQGLEQGKEENKIEMIKSMLENDIDIEKIAKVSDKSIEEIKEIEKTIK